MRIRAKGDADAADCAALMVLTHQLDGYPRYLPDDLAGFVTSPAEITAWVAEDANGVVGHLALHRAEGDPTWDLAHAATGLPADRLAVVARLLVHPRWRRRGLARRLLQTADEHVRRQGRRLVLDVLQESAGAITLYEALGWTRLGAVTLPMDGWPDLELWVYLSPTLGTVSAAQR